MGRKLDLSGLSDLEAAHVLQVVQRDMRLRKREEERLCDLKQELAEEGSRSRLLSTQSCFNQRCCIRCCRQCGDCGYNVCRSCRLYNKKSKGWLCSSCQKHRLLKTQSLEWFYTNVKRRFKRFGSAKVLKTLYKKHLTEHNILSDGYEESVCNDDSICGSDSTFYRQTEEHSMSETLTVARRVAEEAIDEAISKAEVHTYCQVTTAQITQILSITNLLDTLHRMICLSCRKSKMRLTICANIEENLLRNWQQPYSCVQRCHSLSLLDTGADSSPSDSQSLKKEGPGASLSPWKSVDRLDHSALKSPDGNWIVFQSGQLPHPGLLTKRKSQMYSALERESGAVSAYEAMDSDCEPDHSWGTVLNEIHKKMGQSDLLEGLDLDYVGGRRGSRDSEGNYWKSNKALLNKKVPVEIRNHAKESIDFERRESIGDFDVSMFELKAEERSSLEGDTEPDTKEGGKYMGYKTITSLESEFMNEVEDDGPEKSDSEEDEVEFNRIINSMLMMTLEDMEMVEQNLGETNVKVKEEEGGLHNSDNVGGGTDGEEDNNTGKIIEKTGSQDGSNSKITICRFKLLIAMATVLIYNPSKIPGLVTVHVVPQRYSAQSLSSITTEVLKVLNATEQLLRETEGVPDPLSAPSAPLSQNYKQLDQQLCRLEENVYIAAGSVYDLETELEDLEECARAVCSSTSQSELRYLEEQVATAATKVQQSDMQISDIAARIAALRSAGLNVDPQPTFTKTRTSPCITLDASRQQRRLLPAPPTKGTIQTTISFEFCFKFCCL
uniref:RabBD domain-containing protein n=1 Tax=Periophthalmus magnuspinnatus TaxID=409849 RepID=A0A3B4A4T9_9GOBI